MFLPASPTQMILEEYAAIVGLTHLMILAITVGLLFVGPKKQTPQL